MDGPILKFEHFGFQYNAQSMPTLYDIDFEVHRGEKILIAGPSGCGKSTLVHCINGLIPFSYKGEMTGSLTVGGRETKELSLFDLSKIVGTVLQDSDGQFVGLSVGEDIAFSLENDCVTEPELHDRVLEVSKLVDIDGHLRHAPGELSGGQKQRVSMAGVMVDDVQVFLFDEPLANLDPATGKQAIELIDEIQKRTGAAVIIIEHRLEDVLWKHVDRVLLMNSGRIISDTDPDTLLCSSILADNGIREPLYITALKYAGVRLSPDMHPWSIRELTLGESDRKLVRDWFTGITPPRTEEKGEEQLKLEHVSFAYKNGRRAVDDISFTLARGEMAAIVGTNGAGKSTCAKVICGFEKQQEGIIYLNGKDIAGQSIKERADHVGYVLQNPNQMISKVMITEEVGLGLVTRKVPEDEIRERVEKTLKICGLYPFRNWPISALSYGQKKRVTIASVLVLEPEVLILDEPTAGQDYRHYTEIMEFLKELNARGITIIMITHDMHLMLEYARRALVFHESRLIADDTCANILTDSEIVAKASLKETSLYDLARMCGIEEPREFVQRFIDYERKAVRA